MAKNTLAPPARTMLKKSFVRENRKGAGNHTPPTPLSPIGGRVGVGDFPERGASKSNLKNLLAQARELSSEDAKALLAELALINQTPSSGELRDVQMWSLAVYEGLVAAHGGSGAGVPGPLVVQRSIGSGAAWAPVAAFVKAAGFDRLKVVERQNVYHFLADLVIKQAVYINREKGVPLSPRLVGTVSANIAAIFDQSFPGYLKAGLATYVARSLGARSC